MNDIFSLDEFVALLVSAWIETDLVGVIDPDDEVALLVSAWIETRHSDGLWKARVCRTPRECVD